jgi:mannitol-specific phosphotransferase system IIBC component
MKEPIQRIGASMAGTITPNLGAFIARGLNMDNFTTL